MIINSLDRIENSSNYKVIIDNEKYILDESVILKYRLFPNTTIDDSIIESLIKYNDYINYYNKALNYTVKYAKYILNSQFRITEISKEFTEFTGYTKEDITNNVITQLDLIPKTERSEYLCLINKVLANNNLGFFEHRLLCKDNTVKYVICLGRKYFP